MTLCVAAAGALAADGRCAAESGARTLPLVELYTSEGCSSCPPADRWLARTLGPADDAPAAALAFHVDYWDKLGWPDRFARAAWSERQRDIARASRTGVVYTPQVVLQGQDTVAWQSNAATGEIARAAAGAPRAKIAVETETRGSRIAVKASARVSAPAPRDGTRLVVAYTDGGHKTPVKRGENAGVTLAHEHVVRALATGTPADATGMMMLEATMDLPAEAGAHPRLVAFVERFAARDVLQALVVPLDRCVQR
jgi:hypothetical protein